jgi:hypothetical protein
MVRNHIDSNLCFIRNSKLTFSKRERWPQMTAPGFYHLFFFHSLLRTVEVISNLAQRKRTEKPKLKY